MIPSARTFLFSGLLGILTALAAVRVSWTNGTDFAGLVYTLEASTNLIEWNAVVSFNNAYEFPPEVTRSNGLYLATIETNAPRLFFRIRTEGTPPE